VNLSVASGVLDLHAVHRDGRVETCREPRPELAPDRRLREQHEVRGGLLYRGLHGREPLVALELVVTSVVADVRLGRAGRLRRSAEAPLPSSTTPISPPPESEAPPPSISRVVGLGLPPSSSPTTRMLYGM
jgi:hypothetical protein